MQKICLSSTGETSTSSSKRKLPPNPNTPKKKRKGVPKFSLKSITDKAKIKKRKMNVCYVCNAQYNDNDLPKNPWVACEMVTNCRGWAHYRCIGWDDFVE